MVGQPKIFGCSIDDYIEVRFVHIYEILEFYKSATWEYYVN